MHTAFMDNPAASLVADRFVNPRMAIEHIALEAGVLSNLKNLLHGYLPSLVHDLVQMTENLKDHERSEFVKDFLAKDSRANYKAQHLDYMTFGENLTSVPEGFNGLYVPYGQALTKHTDTVLNQINVLLGNINSYLSSFLTNKDYQLSMKDMSKYYENVAKERESALADLANFFSKDKKTISKAQINKILQRMADIKDLKVVMVDLDKRYKKFNLTGLNQRVQETIDLSDMLLKSMKSETIPAVPPAVSKTIAFGLYESARYIEFVSAIYFDIMVYMKCADGLYDRILEA